MYWVNSKLITRIISLRSSLLGATASAIYSKGNTTKIRVNRGGIALLSRKPAISLKRGKIGPRLLLMTNRKSHTRFRLVPKSTTLDDLEEPLCSLFQNMHLSEPATKIWMNIDPYTIGDVCSPVTLVSGNTRKRFMRIFAGVPGDGASSDSGVIKNVDFQGFRTPFP